MVSPHSRRVFLTYGVQTVGSLPTLLTSSWLLATEAPDFISELSLKHLRPQDQSILARLIPMALGVELDLAQAADQKILEQALRGLDQIIDHLSERQREDLLLLLTVLSLPVTRALLNLWTRSDSQARDEVQSTLKLKRFGFRSLMQVIESVFADRSEFH